MAENMKKNICKVTIIMPVYNCEKYLHEAIESILNQTFKDFELLIINDGSKDRTNKILQSYQDLRIVVINNERNLGIVKSLNKGLKLAKGEYIARQDADDISLPERLLKQVRYLDERINIGLLGCGVIVIDEYGNETKRWEIKKDNKEIIINNIAHGSVMMRADCIKQVGGYREELKHVEDNDLWYRIAIKFGVDCLDEYLYELRRCDTLLSITQRNSVWQCKYVQFAKELVEERKRKGRDKLDYLSEREIKKILPRLTLKDRIQQRCLMSNRYLRGAIKLLKNGKKKAFLKFIWKSIMNNPLNYYAWVFLVENFTNKNLAKILATLKRNLIRIKFL